MASDFNRTGSTFYKRSVTALAFDQFPNTVSQYFHPRKLERGDSWIRPGQVCGKIAFVQSGMLRAFAETDTGSHTRWVFLTGEFITSVTSFGRQLPTEEHIEAIEDCELLEITHTDWMTISEQYPKLKTYWTKTLEELIACYESRLHSLLIGDAVGRYKYFLDHYPEFVLHVPQKYVAEMLGIAPRHLSRIRKEISRSAVLPKP